MNDADLIIVLILITAGAFGFIGSMLHDWMKALLIKRAGRTTQHLDLNLDVAVQLHADPVLLAIRTKQPDPVVVEIVTAGGPTQRERAALILANFPTIGPRALARMVQCSPSTAQAIIRDMQAGRLTLPEIPKEEE